MISAILVSNDDGIAAPGLAVLEKIARTIAADVWVVAPETEQSGAGHSLTLHVPVRVREVSARHFAVNGTPTDCVLLAMREVLAKAKPNAKVDLLLSGINSGSNVGDDVTYSGTIAAAMEGTILGVKSIALSQLSEDRENINWEIAEAYAPKLILQLLAIGWPKDTLMNINFPKCTLAEVQGVRICPQGKRKVSVSLTAAIDPKKRPYFWLGGERNNESETAGTDIEWLHKNYITITPLSMDLTDYKTLSVMEAAFKP